jgi:hypothetical protein
MANLPWAEALGALESEVQRLRDAWEAVEFRLLMGSTNPPVTEGVYFEPTIEPLPGDLRVAFDIPLLLQGRMSVIQFLALLQSWTGGQAFSFGGYDFVAPEITGTLSWDKDVPSTHLFNRPLNPLPPTDTEYRFHRLTGGGGTPNTTVRDQINTIAYAMGTTPYSLLEKYMGMGWDGSIKNFSAVVPLPATMLQPSRQSEESLRVCMRYRRPLLMPDFWVRASADVWRSSLPKINLADEQPDGYGWYRGCADVDEPSGEAALNVWAGREGSSQLYDWHVIERAETAASPQPELTTRAFLTAWNRLATRRPASLLGDPAKAATGRGGANVGAAAELLVLNGLAALGYPTFYGPSPFETSGVDIMTFDVTTKTAFAISVTVTEAIADKIGKLVLLREELDAAVGDDWHLSLVVVTIQPRGALVAARLKEANDDDVNVLTGEDLQPLMDESPDLRPFEQALHRRRQVYPPAPSAPGIGTG